MNNNVTRCKGMTTSGDPCKSKPGPSGYCHFHDPELKQQAEEAERRIQEEQEALIHLRQKQLEQVRKAISNLESDSLRIQKHEKKRRLLASVTEGLYIEIEKLTKKAPAEQITELALGQINDVIKDTRELIQNDSYIQKLQVFVSAGDPPELRDALIVLRQIKQGLERYYGSLNINVGSQIESARFVESVLELVLEGHNPTTILEELESKRGVLGSIAFPDKWKTGTVHRKQFNFELLDSINIDEYFKAR